MLTRVCTANRVLGGARNLGGKGGIFFGGGAPHAMRHAAFCQNSLTTCFVCFSLRRFVCTRAVNSNADDAVDCEVDDAMVSAADGGVTMDASRQRPRPNKICLSPETNSGQRLNISVDLDSDLHRCVTAYLWHSSRP